MALRKKHFQVIVLNLKIVPLLQRLQILDDACNDIEEYYHEYDYKHVQCNGFRSFVRIVDSFFYSLAKYSRQSKRSEKTLKEYDTLSRLLCNNAEAASMIRHKGLDYPLQCTDEDCLILEKFISIEPEHMEPLFSKIGIFYVKREFKHDCQQTLAVMHMMTASSFFQKLRIIFSPAYRKRIMSSKVVSLSITEAKNMRNLNQFPMNILLSLVSITHSVSSSKWIRIPRDLSEWAISLPDVKSPAILMRKNRDQRNLHHFYPERKLIKTHFLQPKQVRVKPNSLLIHIPGGAFITFSAKAYVTLMSRICCEVGVPILMPEYAKAPEHPYPAALQDILDMYLFLTSRDPAVISMIGFHPENILISGDSAGGQLATVLLIALNEIRKTGYPVMMPKSIALQYTAAIPGFVVTPGTTMSGLDMFVTIAFSRLTAALYAECEPAIDDNAIHQPVRKLVNRFEIMKRFNDRLQDPLYNPLVYQHYEDFSEIPISILVCEMDSLIDHSILLAKKWKGPVTLDVARGLTHTFTLSRETPIITEEINKLISRFSIGLSQN